MLFCVMQAEKAFDERAEMGIFKEQTNLHKIKKIKAQRLYLNYFSKKYTA